MEHELRRCAVPVVRARAGLPQTCTGHCRWAGLWSVSTNDTALQRQPMACHLPTGKVWFVENHTFFISGSLASVSLCKKLKIHIISKDNFVVLSNKTLQVPLIINYAVKKLNCKIKSHSRFELITVPFSLVLPCHGIPQLRILECRNQHGQP